MSAKAMIKQFYINQESVLWWLNSRWTEITKRYRDEDIFNADVAGLVSHLNYKVNGTRRAAVQSKIHISRLWLTIEDRNWWWWIWESKMHVTYEMIAGINT